MNGPSRLSPQRLRLGRRRLPVPADVSGHSAEGVGERTAPGKPVEIHGSVLVYSVKDYMAARHQSLNKGFVSVGKSTDAGCHIDH